MSWSVAIEAHLESLTLDVAVRGERGTTVIIGPNGAGKTSLLRMIAGAYRPDSGAIAVAGRPVFDADSRLDVPPEHRHIGYVPQGFGLFPHLRVVDNVAFGRSVGKGRKPRATRRREALVLLEELECGHLAERFPKRLSGGEQQRVALARALMIEPELLLLDEPLSTLDPSSRRKLRGFLTSHLASRGAPAIVVTHDVRDVEALGTDIIVLENGRVVQRGDFADLRRQPASEFVAEFFGVAA